jgi:Holliday junction resolvase RusA-like endonuclease
LQNNITKDGWYRFNIPLTARSKTNHRPIFRNKKTGKVFLGKSKVLAEYEKNALLFLNAQRSKMGLREPLSGNMCAVFVFEFKGKCMADGDNLVKGIQDLAAEAQIIANDKLLKHVEFYIEENTGRADRTLLQFGRCAKHSGTVGDSGGGVSYEEAIRSLHTLTQKGQDR